MGDSTPLLPLPALYICMIYNIYIYIYIYYISYEYRYIKDPPKTLPQKDL